MTVDGQAIPRPPRPPVGAAPAARPKAKPSRARERMPWGWLELFVLSQTFLPALLFVPGLTVVRTPVRIAAYAIAPMIWLFVAWSGRRPVRGAGSFPARPWLIFCAGWLALSIFHPNSYSVVAAAAQAALYLSVFSVAFWAPAALTSSRQLSRLMALLFLCNALSALVGVAQVFRPETFNPPVIPAMNNIFQGEDMVYESGGRKILRPCGLTDTPGAVAPAGMAAALFGLCWALLPIAAWKRAASLGLAVVGMAAIYYTQVRLTIVMLGICLLTVMGLLVLQKRWRQVVLLTVLGAVVILGSSAWVVRSSGSAVTERLMTLFTNDPAKLYQESRGGFVQHAFEEVLWEYPLGYGMGWWGMIQASFGDPHRPSPVWVEVMWPAWIYDGGFPLLLAYCGAIAVAMLDSLRITLRSKDRTVAYWGAVIVAFNLSILATCFSFVAFLAPLGLQFWLLAAVLHAADAQSRPVKPKPKPQPNPRSTQRFLRFRGV